MWLSTPTRKRRPSISTRVGPSSPPLSISELQRCLLEYHQSNSERALPPLLPPPNFASPSLRGFLRLWRLRASSKAFQTPSDTTWDEDGVATFPHPEPWRPLATVSEKPAPEAAGSKQSTQGDEINDSPQDIELLGTDHVLSLEPDPPWVDELLNNVAKGDSLKFPWFELKALLSDLLIKRIVYRFHLHLETLYLDSPYPREKLASVIAKKSAGAYLTPTATGPRQAKQVPSLTQLYSRDLQAFLEPRRTLVWHLRSYSFPPFTLPRLCDLLMMPPTPATWATDFWKFAFAVQRCILNIVSAMPMDETEVRKAPRVGTELARRIKRTMWLVDTPTEVSGFMWLSALGSEKEQASPISDDTEGERENNSASEGQKGPETELFHTPLPSSRKRQVEDVGEELENSGRKRPRLEAEDDDEGSGAGRQIHAEILMLRKEVETSSDQLPALPKPSLTGKTSAGEGIYDMFTECTGW